MQSPFKVGDYVAWNMIDGAVMAGQVTAIGYSGVDIRRMDGGMCCAEFSRLRPATLEDRDAACKWFSRIGK